MDSCHGACRRERERIRGNKWVRQEMGRKRKNWISWARAIPSKVTGRDGGEGKEWGSQQTHDCSLGNGVAKASRILTPSTASSAMLAAKP